MTLIDNKVKTIGQIQCKDHEEEDWYSLKDLHTMITYNELLHCHEVYEVGNELLYTCPKSLIYKKVPKGTRIFTLRYNATACSCRLAWEEDGL